MNQRMNEMNECVYCVTRFSYSLFDSNVMITYLHLASLGQKPNNVIINSIKRFASFFFLLLLLVFISIFQVDRCLGTLI